MLKDKRASMETRQATAASQMEDAGVLVQALYICFNRYLLSLSMYLYLCNVLVIHQ